jgi:hypothetical protein
MSAMPWLDVDSGMSFFASCFSLAFTAATKGSGINAESETLIDLTRQNDTMAVIETPSDSK